MCRHICAHLSCVIPEHFGSLISDLHCIKAFAELLTISSRHKMIDSSILNECRVWDEITKCSQISVEIHSNLHIRIEDFENLFNLLLH